MIISTMIAADKIAVVDMVDVGAVDAIIKTIVVIAIAILILTQMMMVAGPKKTVTTTRIALSSRSMTAQLRCIVLTIASQRHSTCLISIIRQATEHV